MDQDSTVKKFAHEDILKSFSSGEYNVLLGTQMVAKGHDIPNVTLVGILSGRFDAESARFQSFGTNLCSADTGCRQSRAR